MHGNPDVGPVGGTGEEGMRKVRDSCCSQLQVHGHLSLNGAVRRGLMANFGNLSPNTSHIRKHPSPSFFIQPHSVLPASSPFFSSLSMYVAWFHT